MMSESKEISIVLSDIQTFTPEGVLDNAPARADLLALAKRLTTLLEGPVNRATDLVFKVNVIKNKERIRTSY
jgi:hypothetical protein